MQDPHFVIQKPTTSDDHGLPSESCREDMDRVLRLVEDERHLIAKSLYDSVRERLVGGHSEFSPHTNRLRLRKFRQKQRIDGQTEDKDEARKIIATNQKALDDLEKRCLLFSKARENLLDDNHWTLAQTMFGITTYYRREEDGSLSVKMEGSLEGIPLFDQVAVLREVDLHYKWAPFCSSSKTIAHLDKLDTVGWIAVGLPSFGLMRDACFRAIGCDSMLEDGSLLIVGLGIADKPEDGVVSTALQKTEEQSAEKTAAADEFDFLSKDPILKELDIPDPPNRIGSGRMTIRTFQALVHVDSPTKARTRLIANVDPNLPFVPHSLLDFVMKKLCGIMLNKLQNAAKRVSKDPIHNIHAAMMRREEDFYKDWLMKKFEMFCKLRKWEMPPVACFHLTDTQLELAQEEDEKKLRKKVKRPYLRALTNDRLDEFFSEVEQRPRFSSEPVGDGTCPKIHTSADSSTVSDISRTSSSTFSMWQKNPIAAYLRELEERTQLKKAREIQQYREKAAKRLKPKPLDVDSKNRLEVLRKARFRHSSGRSSSGENISISEDATISQSELLVELGKRDWATLWTNHGTAMRAGVMSFLIPAFFVLLYGNWMFEDFIVKGGTHWFRDGATTFVYMVLCAGLHFLISYIALMYAFSALQIGSIAGNEAKRFYGSNVNVALGITSGGNIIFGFAKAATMTALRWSAWKLSLLFDWIGNEVETVGLWALGMIPEGFVSSMAPFAKAVINLISKVFQFLVYTLLAFLYRLDSIFVESNVFGRAAAAVVDMSMGPMAFLWRHSRLFWKDAVGSSKNWMETYCWREEAFSASRYLLAHSLVFLLVSTTIFIILARLGQVPKVSTGLQDSDVSGSAHGRKVEELTVSEPLPRKMKGGSLNGERSHTQLSPRSSSVFQSIQEISGEAPEEDTSKEFQHPGLRSRKLRNGLKSKGMTTNRATNKKNLDRSTASI